VGDEEHRKAEAVAQRLQFAAQQAAQRRVEGGERLVEQQDARLDRERPRQRHALLLAAR